MFVLHPFQQYFSNLVEQFPSHVLWKEHVLENYLRAKLPKHLPRIDSTPERLLDYLSATLITRTRRRLNYIIIIIEIDH